MNSGVFAQQGQELINPQKLAERIINQIQTITCLLAELERVESSREAERMECEKLACTEIVDHIKAHFKLQEAPK